MTDQALASQIAEISPLSYESALAALRTGGQTRELALSILDSAEKYKQDLQQISEARQKLRVPA